MRSEMNERSLLEVNLLSVVVWGWILWFGSAMPDPECHRASWVDPLVTWSILTGSHHCAQIGPHGPGTCVPSICCSNTKYAIMSPRGLQTRQWAIDNWDGMVQNQHDWWMSNDEWILFVLKYRENLWFFTECPKNRKQDKYTGRWNVLLGIAVCWTSSGTHGSTTGSSSRD